MFHAMHLSPPRHATLGLTAIFGSTFFELVAHFMLMPLLLLRMKGADVSSTLAGLFSAAGWLGIFAMTPFASAIAHRLGQRVAMWLAAGVLTAVAVAYAFTDQVAWWFALNLVSGLAMALRSRCVFRRMEHPAHCNVQQAAANLEKQHVTCALREIGRIQGHPGHAELLLNH